MPRCCFCYLSNPALLKNFILKMIDDDRGDKNNSSDVMQSRPNSGLFSKRSLPVTDDDVGLILSSRVKKFSVEIPSAQLVLLT